MKERKSWSKQNAQVHIPAKQVHKLHKLHKPFHINDLACALQKGADCTLHKPFNINDLAKCTNHGAFCTIAQVHKAKTPRISGRGS